MARSIAASVQTSIARPVNLKAHRKHALVSEPDAASPQIKTFSRQAANAANVDVDGRIWASSHQDDQGQRCGKSTALKSSGVWRLKQDFLEPRLKIMRAAMLLQL